MPLVEGIRGPDPVRWCDCGQFTLQQVGVFYTDDDLRRAGLPSEYSHLGPLCPVCEDEEKSSERISTGARVA